MSQLPKASQLSFIDIPKAASTDAAFFYAKVYEDNMGQKMGMKRPEVGYEMTADEEFILSNSQ
jgi:hypothetical protein